MCETAGVCLVKYLMSSMMNPTLGEPVKKKAREDKRFRFEKKEHAAKCKCYNKHFCFRLNYVDFVFPVIMYY